MMASDVDLRGGCFCSAIRYAVTAPSMMKAQCHCRACQHTSGGGLVYFMVVPPEGFAFTKGTPSTHMHPDSVRGVTREFCSDCGTHLTTRRRGQDYIVLKVGTLDDPAAYGDPEMAIFCAEKAPFHLIPEDLPRFDGLPEK